MSKPLPADLARVDPAHAWEAWVPDKSTPWSTRWAAHLYRRAAFGANPAGIARAVKARPAAAIDTLLKGEPGHEKNDALLAEAGRRFAAAGIGKLRAWWAYCMLHS